MQGCVGCVGAGGVGTGVGGQGLLTCGRVGGHDVGADVGTLGVWTGGTPSIGGLLTVLLIVLFTVLFGMLVAVFVLLGVSILGLLVLVWFFVLVMFVPFILGFTGATSLVVLGSGSRDGLSSGVVIGWCGLLARGAAKGSTWGCNTDATGGQHVLGINTEIKQE